MPPSDDLRLTSRSQTAIPGPVSFPQYQERDNGFGTRHRHRRRLRGAEEMMSGESYPACAIQGPDPKPRP